MFNFSFVRMAGALKIHLHPIILSSKSVKKFFESVKNILENVKIFIFVVNKSIRYLLFRVYSTEDLMKKENSWGHKCVLDKEKIIREFVGFTPVMNRKEHEECLYMFLDKVIVNGVQDLGLTPFEEFLPRSAPLVDFYL